MHGQFNTGISNAGHSSPTDHSPWGQDAPSPLPNNELLHRCDRLNNSGDADKIEYSNNKNNSLRIHFSHFLPLRDGIWGYNSMRHLAIVHSQQHEALGNSALTTA